MYLDVIYRFDIYLPTKNFTMVRLFCRRHGICAGDCPSGIILLKDKTSFLELIPRGGGSTLPVGKGRRRHFRKTTGSNFFTFRF
jgi:hypothetical protein